MNEQNKIKNEESDINKEIEKELLSYLDSNEHKQGSDSTEKKKFKTPAFLVMLILAIIIFVRYISQMM